MARPTPSVSTAGRLERARLLQRPGAAGPEHRQARRGQHRRSDQAVPGEPRGRRRGGRRTALRRRPHGHLRDGHGHLQGRQRGVRHLLRDRPAGALDDRRLGAPRSARRSRSMPSSPSPTDTEVTAAEVEAARPGALELAQRTPMLSSRTISERAGGVVALKAENLQRTGSFKVRSVAAKLASLGDDGCRNGVVAASAGNHGQALAAARQRGVHCEVFVPSDAPLAKVEAARGHGAEIHVGGESVDECLKGRARARRRGGLAFVHPFDDPMVVAGQGSLGLELLEDVPDLAKVVVPVGGGGLCSSVAIAVKSARPDVEVVGVQVAACAPCESLRREGDFGRLRADDRRRDRGQAPRRPHAAAARSLGRRRRGRGRGRDRRGDGRADGAREARRRGRGRRRRRCAARRPGACGGVRHDGRGPLRRQRRRGPARLDRAPARDRGRPPAQCSSRACPTALATSRGCSTASPAGGQHRRRLARAPRASTCTCARPPSSS